MRPKRIPIILACLTAVVVACAYFVITKPKPSISMGLLEYQDGKNNDYRRTCAVVGLTNNGSIMVRWDHVDPDEPFLLRTESRTGWATNTFKSFEKMTISPSFLAPGSNTSLYVYLPDGTLRWQLRYTIHKASLESRIGNYFTGDWEYRAYRLIGYLNLTNEGPPQLFWSEVYELPDGKKLDTPTNAAIRGSMPGKNNQ